MKFLNELKIIKESYRLYHDTYSSAVQHAIKETEDMGYTVDEDDYYMKVASGPRKPSPGDTNSFSIKLLRDGEPARKRLHMQIYNMGSDQAKNSYELNMYVA